jgi:hypothetical protein
MAQRSGGASARIAFLASVCSAVVALGCTLILQGLPALTRGEHEHFVVPVTINGTPVTLALDTGAGTSALFRPSALRLGLRITEWPADQPVAPGMVGPGTTEPVALVIWGKRLTTELHVIDLPSALVPRFDGVLGWLAFRDNVLRFDGLHAAFLSRVPEEAARWRILPFRSDASVLALTIPGRAGGTETIQIDTGGSDGISLNVDEWREWTVTHPTPP